jgi:GH15 family glucan-1,4-alpha-glucosidase
MFYLHLIIVNFCEALIINYKEISDYAAIGNLRTVALVGKDGSIDWLCCPELDDASVFSAILDEKRGGYFRIQPEDVYFGSQNYLGDSCVVITNFQTKQGELKLTDFMPLKTGFKQIDVEKTVEIHRLLECAKGNIKVTLEWYPRFNFGRDASNIVHAGQFWVASSEKEFMVLGGLNEGKVVKSYSDAKLSSTFNMKKGDRKAFVLKWNSNNFENELDSSDMALNHTVEKWKELLNPGVFDKEEWVKECLPLIKRSALTLKLLTHIDSGAIAAAATTSLPEWIGGGLNWDYRYSWIRDSALTTQALVMLGLNNDAVRFLEWAEDNHERYYEREKRLHVMYGFHGEVDFAEKALDCFEGYKGSKPVRLGNRAFEQTQHGIFGDVFSIAYELLRRDVKLNDNVMVFLTKVADYACEVWNQPDHGIWELSESLHYVESKVMVWMALDRALVLSKKHGLKGNIEKWRKTRSEIYRDVLAKGYDEELGSFVQSYGSKYLDASNLRLPLLEFLPIEDKRVQGTIKRVMDELTVNGHVYRCNSPVEKAIGNKGTLPREEGAFNLCTFWLIDVLSLSGRVAEARKLFKGIIKRVNDVGLFSEEIDPRNGEFLGNFPQAFTHIGLINSAMYLAYAEGKQVPIALIGTEEHKKEVSE